LTIRDLADAGTGAIVAAPEFDPMYELSGGYGYCWPRDAAEVCSALAALGELTIPRRALDWCARTQQGSGHWYQRYWSDGFHAPSWCVYPDFYQLDQTCSSVFAACRFAGHLAGPERTEYLRDMSRTVRVACDALKRSIASDGLHETAADLWEVHRGSFTYTNAALCAALNAAERVFGIPADGLPQRVKAAILKLLWLEQEGRFARGLGTTRELDCGMDSSILGVFDPYSMLDLSQPDERRMAARTLEAVEGRLSVDVRGGKAILRFEGEDYMGGGPGVVNTLWTARAHLRLAAAYRDAGLDADVTPSVQAAAGYVEVALASTNPTGQLPELIPWNGYPYWAAPHGWASALMIDCIRMLRGFEVDAPRARPA
jgi:GH15 family glucan-1,4-alpha-glucosidase